MNLIVPSIKMFDASEISTLKEFFDYVIPATSNNGMPGASFLFDFEVNFSASDILLFKKVLTQISDFSKTKYENEYVKLGIIDKQIILKTLKQRSTRNFNALAFGIMRHYYTNNTILEAIGVKSRPPFPDGNSILEGDMLLFEQVYEKGQIYRD
jgi:hypothetical protein